MMPSLSRAEVRAFRRHVYRLASRANRKLPWRPPVLSVRTNGTVDPYRVLVSELMLQQTQATRVIPFYRRFLKRFPTLRALARAPLGDVLASWQGLGYNRRAKMLHQAAAIILERYNGRVPDDRRALEALPGVGRYTAGALRVFAFNKPDICIETNIRTVFIHFFFRTRTTVRDDELVLRIRETLDNDSPRAWYMALMDAGALMKREGNSAHRASVLHKRQKPFRGSDREIRGAFIRLLTKAPNHRRVRDTLVREVSSHVGATASRTERVLGSLVREGLVTVSSRSVSLPR